jgi:hypothetical protein
MDAWVLQHMVTTTPQDWKYVVCIKHAHNADIIRIFLRHHGFTEQPLKNSVYEHGQNRHYVAVMPYHPTTKHHVHSEQVDCVHVHEYDNIHIELSAVNDFVPSGTPVQISKSRIEYGSVFVREDLGLTITLVENVHVEEYGKSCHSKKRIVLLLSTTWSGTCSPSGVQKLLNQIEKIQHLFDFV